MYYPIGWPRKLFFNLDPSSSARETVNNSGEINESLNRLKLNGNSSESNPSTNNIPNGHVKENCDETPTVNGVHDQGPQILQIIANSDRSLLLILTSNSLRLWYPKPSLEIVSHARNPESVENLGENEIVNWKPDSTMIVVKTSKDILLFYKVVVDDPPEYILEANSSTSTGYRRSGSICEAMIPSRIPSIYLFLTNLSTNVTFGISSILAAEEEVVVATKSGELIGVNWNGTLDPNFRWEVSDGSEQFAIKDLRYSSMIGGFSMIFANGKAAFMPIHYKPKEGVSPTGSTSSQNIRQRRSSTSGVSSNVLFVPDVSNGSVAAINHKYQMIAFGLQSGQGILCCIDEDNSVVLPTHKLSLPSSIFPESASTTIGAMKCMQWSPDSTVIATSWEKEAFAIWSVFGALLICSLSWDFGSHVDKLKSSHFVVTSMSWAKEGFQLWLINREKDEEKEKDVIVTLSLAKSALTTNPAAVTSSRESLLLVSDDRLHLGVGNCVDGNISQNETASLPKTKITKDDEEILPSTNAVSSLMEWKQSPVEVGNHQWIVVQIPSSYLSFNWPIRLSAVDKGGQSIAIAGKTGFAHYNHSTRKWKLFGNESQERDFEVCGGLLWFDHFIILACYSFVEDKFELRAYSKNQPLNNQFGTIVTIQQEVQVMSLHKNRLIVLQTNGALSLYQLSIGSTGLLQMKFEKNIVISNLIVSPECIISIFLTTLQRRPSNSSSQAPERDSMLINISGRIFLLEKEDRLPDESDPVTISFRAVSVLASGVENIWLPPNEMQGSYAARPHLTGALWLSRGNQGMSVWLPLLPTQAEKSYPAAAAHTFISERIMLPVRCHIYPLAVLVGDSVVIGAENETSFWSNCSVDLPFCKISRTSQVYLPHILRELLKRNLGNHAWEIANTCSSLAYFPHSLELLLHETLEDEAVLSQPIPDALLPRVIGFIREFPNVFLETIVHCARKTELAMWPHLFAIVGNPKELFQSCLDGGRLETAASYLLVLQNLEHSSVSKKYAILLLETSKKSGNKQLENDLSRFLQVIWPTGQPI